MRRKRIRIIAVAATCLGIAGGLLSSVAAGSGSRIPYLVQPIVNAPLSGSHEAFIELGIANFDSAADLRLQFYTQTSGGSRHPVVPGLPAQPPVSGVPPISHRPHLRGKIVDLGWLTKGQHFIAGFTLPCRPNMRLELYAGAKHYNVSKLASLNALLQEVC